MVSTKFYYYTSSALDDDSISSLSNVKQPNKRQNFVIVGSIYQILRPLLLPVSFFGLFPATFPRNSANGDVAHKYIGFNTFSHFMSFFLLVMQAYNLYKSAFALYIVYENTTSDHKKSFDVVTFTVRPLLDSVFAVMYIVIAQLKTKQFVNHFGRWTTFDPIIVENRSHLKNHCWKTIVVFWFSYVTYVASATLYILALTPTYILITYKTSPAKTVFEAAKIFGISINFFASAAFLSVLHLLSKCACVVFAHLSTELQQLLQRRNCKRDVGNKLRLIRQRHLYLCEILADAGQIFSPIILLDLCLTIISLCSSGYNLLVTLEELNNEPLNLCELIATLTAIALRVISLWFTCCSWEQLEENCHEMADVVYRSDTRLLTRDERLQVQYIESEVTKNSARISVFGLFDLNRSLLVTIIGIIATYVVVMVEVRDVS
ncbi:hypothetical protein CHUAL_007612 [Chamberlinius hualienensis]